MANERLTVFATDKNGNLTHRWYDTAKDAWTGWVPFKDGTITSAPAVVMANERLTVFATDKNGNLTHRWYDTAKDAWTGWVILR
jgi:uncharacterized protein YodC (DUF2158 family)